jgi:hypothetical protein
MNPSHGFMGAPGIVMPIEYKTEITPQMLEAAVSRLRELELGIGDGSEASYRAAARAALEGGFALRDELIERAAALLLTPTVRLLGRARPRIARALRMDSLSE